MIVAVNANPMVEYVFPLPALREGQAHHPKEAWAFATGKSINAARALHHLGEDVLTVVAAGGARGKEVVGRLRSEGLRVDPVPVSGESRIGFVTYHQGRVTTLYGPGSVLTNEEVDALVAKVATHLPARLLVLAGSVSHPDLWPRLAALDVPLVLDLQHPCFIDCLALGDVVIAKPNRHECRTLLGEPDPERAAELLAQHGAKWAVVTDGDQAAVFRSGAQAWRVTPPTVRIHHPVGCGDALCAGLIHAQDRDPVDAIAFAMACGAHNASRPEIGVLDVDACETLARRIVPQPLRARADA